MPIIALCSLASSLLDSLELDDADKDFGRGLRSSDLRAPYFDTELELQFISKIDKKRRHFEKKVNRNQEKED